MFQTTFSLQSTFVQSLYLTRLLETYLLKEKKEGKFDVCIFFLIFRLMHYSLLSILYMYTLRNLTLNIQRHGSVMYVCPNAPPTLFLSNLFSPNSTAADRRKAICGDVLAAEKSFGRIKAREKDPPETVVLVILLFTSFSLGL